MTKLEEMRTKRGISRAQLAEASGVSARTIEAYEHELKDINRAAVENVYRIAKALYCKIEDITNL